MNVVPILAKSKNGYYKAILEVVKSNKLKKTILKYVV